MPGELGQPVQTRRDSITKQKTEPQLGRQIKPLCAHFPRRFLLFFTDLLRLFPPVTADLDSIAPALTLAHSHSAAQLQNLKSAGCSRFGAYLIERPPTAFPLEPGGIEHQLKRTREKYIYTVYIYTHF